jgi:hypothetical protein
VDYCWVDNVSFHFRWGNSDQIWKQNISLAMYEGLYTDLNGKEEVKRNYTKLKSWIDYQIYMIILQGRCYVLIVLLVY